MPADGLAPIGARPSAYHTKHPNEYQLYFDHVHFMQNVCSKNVSAEDNSRVICLWPCGLQANWLFQVYHLADHTISHILINLTVQRWDKANTTSMVQAPNKFNIWKHHDDISTINSAPWQWLPHMTRARYHLIKLKCSCNTLLMKHSVCIHISSNYINVFLYVEGKYSTPIELQSQLSSLKCLHQLLADGRGVRQKLYNKALNLWIPDLISSRYLEIRIK